MSVCADSSNYLNLTQSSPATANLWGWLMMGCVYEQRGRLSSTVAAGTESQLRFFNHYLQTTCNPRLVRNQGWTEGVYQMSLAEQSLLHHPPLQSFLPYICFNSCFSLGGKLAALPLASRHNTMQTAQKCVWWWIFSLTSLWIQTLKSLLRVCLLLFATVATITTLLTSRALTGDRDEQERGRVQAGPRADLQ